MENQYLKNIDMIFSINSFSMKTKADIPDLVLQSPNATKGLIFDIKYQTLCYQMLKDSSVTN